MIGPSWGGTLVPEAGKQVTVYTDHRPEPIGVSANHRAGARRLARFHGMRFTCLHG
ncbi:hypothetical protein GCM10027187_40380 [Streptosporangium sandarakinum]|uniref:Uncharacterized protein n=1 Tax=Streptosporangium sandarakinum TaxID=1260955 RepID=A0A852VE30_9ACTN|nr:hypothetical protein [Streptosporangium sandarakinum]NYF44631.1 hypothetical protein [Streptosporangium sandarakinum]